MFASGQSASGHHRYSSQWPIETTSASPAVFNITVADQWAMDNDAPQYDTHHISPPPTSLDHAFTSSSQSMTHRLSGDFSSDHDELYASSWKSPNLDHGSSSSAITDFGVAHKGQEAIPKKPVKARRRKRKYLDPEELHNEKLEKNRRAAERCRIKQKAYVSTLQERAREEEVRRADLVAQVTQLRDMILSLKEDMVSHSGCTDERIKQYLLSDLFRTTQRRHDSMSSMPPTQMLSPSAQFEMLR
jgi:hypothetical protein